MASIITCPYCATQVRPPVGATVVRCGACHNGINVAEAPVAAVPVSVPYVPAAKAAKIVTMVLCHNCDYHLPYPPAGAELVSCPRCRIAIDLSQALAQHGRTAWAGGAPTAPRPAAAQQPVLQGIPVSSDYAAAAVPAAYSAPPPAAPTPAAAPLPAGWEERYDAASRRPYYVNHHSQTTQWDRPAATGPAAQGAPTDDDAALRQAILISEQEAAGGRRGGDDDDEDLRAAIEASKATAPLAAPVPRPADHPTHAPSQAPPALAPPPSASSSVHGAPPPAAAAPPPAAGGGALINL